MKLPDAIKKRMFDASGAFDMLSMYGYLSSHRRDVRFDVSTDVKVEPEQAFEPTVWAETLDGTGLRPSSLRGGSFISPLTLDDYTFRVEPIISVSSSRLVVQTQMSGGIGPVVEEVAEEGYQVTIRGLLINEDNDNYPFDQVARLNNLCRKQEGLKCVNNILNQCFGIERLVVKTLSVPGEQGMQSMQPYTITAVSDRDVQLELREGWA